MPEFIFPNIPVKYVIFDMDGVLIDSEPVSIEAAKTALAEIGIYAKASDFTPYIGTGEKNFIIAPCKKHGKEEYIPAAIKRFYKLFGTLAKEKLTVFPSVHPLLNELKNRNLTLAIASSSSREKLTLSLAAAKISEAYFDVILSGSDISEKKPSPEIYMTAVRKLSAKSEECLVIEDAVSGVIAAKAAACRCFAVTTAFKESELAAVGADFVSDDIINVLNIL